MVSAPFIASTAMVRTDLIADEANSLRKTGTSLLSMSNFMYSRCRIQRVDQFCHVSNFHLHQPGFHLWADNIIDIARQRYETGSRRFSDSFRNDVRSLLEPEFPDVGIQMFNRSGAGLHAMTEPRSMAQCEGSKQTDIGAQIKNNVLVSRHRVSPANPDIHEDHRRQPVHEREAAASSYSDSSGLSAAESDSKKGNHPRREGQQPHNRGKLCRPTDQCLYSHALLIGSILVRNIHEHILRKAVRADFGIDRDRSGEQDLDSGC